MLDSEARGLRIVDCVGLDGGSRRKIDSADLRESRVAHRQRNALFVQPLRCVSEQAHCVSPNVGRDEAFENVRYRSF